MKKIINVLALTVFVANTFGMHQAFVQGDQVKEVLDRCSGLKKLIPIFDEQFECTVSLSEVQRLVAQLDEGIAYCQAMGAQLETDGWPKAARDVVDCCRLLGRAVQTVRDYIDYVQDPMHARRLVRSVQSRYQATEQFDEE